MTARDLQTVQAGARVVCDSVESAGDDWKSGHLDGARAKLHQAREDCRTLIQQLERLLMPSS